MSFMAAIETPRSSAGDAVASGEMTYRSADDGALDAPLGEGCFARRNYADDIQTGEKRSAGAHFFSVQMNCWGA